MSTELGEVHTVPSIVSTTKHSFDVDLKLIFETATFAHVYFQYENFAFNLNLIFSNALYLIDRYQKQLYRKLCCFKKGLEATVKKHDF